MKKKVLSLALAMLMVLSLLPASFAEEEILDDVVVEDEVVEVVADELPTEEEPIAVDGGLLDLIRFKSNDCKNVFEAVNAVGGVVTVKDRLSVKGAVDNGAWIISADKDWGLYVNNYYASLKTTSVVLYLSDSVAGKYEAADVENNFEALYSNTVKYYPLGNYIVLTGSFPAECRLTLSSGELPVVKVEVYTEHYDTNGDGKCELCEGEAFTYTQRLAFNLGRTIGAFTQASESKDQFVTLKISSILGTVFDSFFGLFRSAL